MNSSSPDPFGRYAGEILRAEGFNEFQIEELDDVDAAYLNNFDIVILTETPLTGAQVTMLDSYVSGGGNLIAFRPDKQLAALFGLADAGGTTAEGYLLVDTGTAIGHGIVAETMQFHGEADHYSLAGASVIATLYSNATATKPDAFLSSVAANAGLPPANDAPLGRSVQPALGLKPLFSVALQRMETNQACAIMESVICRYQLCQQRKGAPAGPRDTRTGFLVYHKHRSLVVRKEKKSDEKANHSGYRTLHFGCPVVSTPIIKSGR